MCHKHYVKCLVPAGLLVFVTPASLAKDAKLRIEVKPKQAYAFVDGSTFGHGNRNISMAPGSHTIGVYNYGVKPEIREVSLKEGE